MNIYCSGIRCIAFSIFLAMPALLPLAVSAGDGALYEPIITIPLNMSLPAVYTAPPPSESQTNLNLSQNIYQGSLHALKIKKTHPYGYQQVKLDKSMRIRGWKIKDQLYVGQARVGKQWGLGVMMTQGNFTYGWNNKGVGMIYKGENSVYRINMQEISLKIDF